MAKPSKYFALETSGNAAEITIYGDITSWPWLESDVSAYLLSKQLSELDVDEISVNINSYGGEVAEGVAIYNALKRHKARIRTRVDGFACSVASVIFAAGDERVMNNASLLMIHNAWQRAVGNAAELRKAADDLELINDMSVKAYMAVSTASEEEIRTLMDSETWLDPDKAVELGFATSIENGESDKPSQNVRRKVMQMVKQADEDDQADEDPDDATDEESEADVTVDDPDGTEDDQQDDDQTDDQADDQDDQTDDQEDDQDEENAQQKAFLRAIMSF